jgi:hypothetical protein
MELKINVQLLNDKYLLENDFHFLLTKMFAIVYGICLLISIKDKIRCEILMNKKTKDLPDLQELHQELKLFRVKLID